MAWVKLDDQWMDHPKIIRAGRDARDMWLASITWCAKHLTDGYFPANLIPQLAVMAGVDVANCQTFATTLLDLCLWDASENGYMVHDYLDYNPTKEQVLATRDARKDAGSKGGKQKASNLLSKNVAKVCPIPIPQEEYIRGEKLSDKFSSLLGVGWGDNNEPDEAESICLEYPEAEIISAAAWLREKHPKSMRAALSALRTTLKNGSWNMPAVSRSNGNGHHNSQSKSTITRNSDGTFNI